MTREEQIELMKECIEDAELALREAHDPLLPPSLRILKVAFRFFDYRLRQMVTPKDINAALEQMCVAVMMKDH